VTVYKRQGSPHWVIEFQHLGQHVRRSSGTTSKAAAKVLEQKWRQEIYDRVKLGKAPTVTLGEAAARYYETTLKPGGKPAKLARDLGYLKQIKDAFGADRKLSEITQAEVAKWRDELVTKHGLAPSSANRVYTVLRAIVNKARDEWQVDAPRWSLRQLETDSDRVRYLSEAEERQLLLALPPHVRDFLTVAMDSGGRKGELEALTWDKIEWGEQRVTLLLPASDTKGGKARRVPVTKRSTDILKRLRKDHPDAAGVFMYERAGETRELGNVRKPFETACKRAGITDFRIHDCRHHFASRLAQRGATLQEIKELMGHASIEMTLRYAHLCQSNLDRAVALLD
jgi:integrase